MTLSHIVSRLIHGNVEVQAQEVARVRHRFNLLDPRLPSTYRAPRRLARYAKRCQSCGRPTFVRPSRCASPSCPSGHNVCPRCSERMDEERALLTAVMAQARRREEERQFAALMSRGPSSAAH